uniref:MFS domain-containing protein n=1 Tax=Panagrellus redivivus TaxID=6233 RepID=A0A7E4VW54_PANRE
MPLAIVKRWLAAVSMEPALFLYMCSSFMKFPVFQTLLYEKSCIARYTIGACQDLGSLYDDKALQKDANLLFLVSSLILVIPSIFSALILGSLSDSWNIKVPMLIPVAGLILGDLNYIIQAVYIQNNVYWLMLSDFLFGICGGYTAVIGTILAYNVKVTAVESRSERVAAFEGSIGLGSTIGLLLSGVVRQAVGYPNTFLIMMVMHVAMFFYICVMAKDLNYEEDSTIFDRNILSRFYDVFNFVSDLRNRPIFMVITVVLVALGIELFVFAGLLDVLYSFFRFKLGWNDVPYGWFNGLSNAINSVFILVVYPLMLRIGFTDICLSIVGLSGRVISLVMLAFVFADWWAYLCIIPMALNRFITTGLRATTSKLVEDGEQGKLFALVSLIEGVTSIPATLVFNGLYPLTLDFFAGTIFLAVAVVLLLPIGFLLFIQKKLQRINEADSPNSTETNSIATST